MAVSKEDVFALNGLDLDSMDYCEIIKSSIDLYAADMAIEFAKFLNDNLYMDDGGFYLEDGHKKVRLEIKELFKEFQKQ